MMLPLHTPLDYSPPNLLPCSTEASPSEGIGYPHEKQSFAKGKYESSA